MTKEARLKRRSHKLLLVILKVIPVITALCYMLNTTLACFGIDAFFFSHISGMSLLPWLFILIATYVFRFCIYHRMFLYYILMCDIINMTDYYIGIPVDTFNMLILHFVITGVFMLLILHFYVKCHKETLEQID